MNPTISVIMPCYNRADLIRKSISSVLDQTYKDFELIVVDDGSTDNSLKVIGSIKDSRIKVISQENKGPSAARNTGIKNARGKYIAFLDSDDNWDKTFLEKMHSALKSDPDAALVYCGWQNIGNVPKEKAIPFVPPDYEKKENKIELFLQGCRWPIHAALTRKKLIDKAGHFDEDLLIAEDYLLWLKIASFNKIILVPEVLAYYYFHENVHVMADKKRKINDVLLAKKKFLKKNPKLIKQIGKKRINELLQNAKSK